jgi:deoxyribodipyrimidine photolyase
MTILDILKGTDKVILANIDLLAKDYFEKKGKKLNKGCSACVIEMVLTLKNIYEMANFKFKRPAASYKNLKGDKTTISDSTMTDEKALKFLKTNPKRIELFSVFPKNWKKLIEGKIETEKERQTRIAIEAELAAGGNTETEEEKKKRLLTEATTEAINGNTDFLKKLLSTYKLGELREAYPGIKAASITDFVDKVLAIK